MNTPGWPVTALMTCSTFVTPVSGESREARYVADKLNSVRVPLQDSRSIGVQALMDDLHALAEECTEDGWDGYGARALSHRSYTNAELFIRCLGTDARGVSFGASARGWVTMQWGPSSRWTLSLTITDDGWIHWAALFGSGRQHGTAPFMGAIPKNIADLIGRACIA